MEEFLSHYGYFALTLGVLIEGEAMLIAGSFASHRGYLSLPVVILIAFIVTTILDWAYFYLGRIKGTRYLESKPKLQLKIKKVYSWIERNPYGILFTFRFLYGFRILIPILLGTTKIKTYTFLFCSAISTFIWACAYGLAGYFIGAVFTTFLKDIKRYETPFILGVVIAGFGYWLYRWTIKRKEIPIKPTEILH